MHHELANMDFLIGRIARGIVWRICFLAPGLSRYPFGSRLSRFLSFASDCFLDMFI